FSRTVVMLSCAPALALLPTPCNAAWDDPLGNIVAPAVYGGPTASVADGAGGVLIAYPGAATAAGAAIRVQHVRADGTLAPGWPAEGVVAASPAAPNLLGTLLGVSDGAGGAFLLW